MPILATTSASPCLNDRDTKAVEWAGRLKYADVIVGRFERNPPLYYEMRINRIRTELATNPNQPDLYDDISVAFDRLGNDKEAINWIRRKAPFLQGDDPKSEAWYRYHANLGTFLIHDWLHDGAKLEDIKRAEAARNEIRRALEIKPNAHFGRERYQQVLMDKVIFKKTQPSEYFAIDLPGSPEETVAGLAGLVALGNAWESPDVFSLLAFELDRQMDYATAQLSVQRVEELAKVGKRSVFFPDVSKGSDIAKKFGPLATVPRTEQNAKENFDIQRKNAEEWHKNRTDFMLAKMRLGKHPDTDPHFWDGYVETPRVPYIGLPGKPFWANPTFIPYVLIYFGVGLILVLIARAIILGIVSYLRR